MTTNESVPGTFVMGHGSIKGKMASAVGGAIGSLAHSAVTARSTEGLLPKGQIAYLAAYPEQVVLFGVKRGQFKPKATDEILANVHRAEIHEVQLESKALYGTIHVRFRGGDSWTFDVPRVHRSAARRVVDALSV